MSSENQPSTHFQQIATQSSSSLNQGPVSDQMSQADTTRDDMFVDASEELNLDSKEAMDVGESESRGTIELENMPNGEAKLSNGMIPVAGDDNLSEIGQLRALLEQALRDKESVEREYMEEKEALVMMINVKDQEIEGLNAKIVEFSVNQNAEFAMDRILSALPSVVSHDELYDGSGGDKVAFVEKGMSILIHKVNQFVYGSYQLSQCLSKAESDFGAQGELGDVFSAACNELVELRRKEEELLAKLGHLEQQNKMLLEQVESEKSMVEMVNSELGKTKQDLEQEKQRYANTKEKLSMAVTKGKALVQERYSLKQSLADRTNELEKCLAELDKKSNALEASERSREEFVRNENLLQESLSQRNLMLETFEYILSQTDVPEEVQSVDVVGRARWLVNERKDLQAIYLDFQRVKDTISSLDCLENIPTFDVKARIAWLKESYYQFKEEIHVLQDEVSRTREAAHNEIENLNASILNEKQEKYDLRKQLDDLVCKYEDIVEKTHQLSLEKDRLSVGLSTEIQEKSYIQKELEELESKHEDMADKVQQISSEKDQMVSMLLEGFGISMEDQERISLASTDLHGLIDMFVGSKAIEQKSTADASHFDGELLERLKNLLYLQCQELMICEEMLEEDAMLKSKVNDLSNELKVTSEELHILKEEKDILQKDLERSEEKTSLIREKLSIAVKKGKGLVQDRENSKLLIDEKNSEIEKLKSELQQNECKIAEKSDQISKISTHLERIPGLESELDASRDQLGQLEKLLSESNNFLQSIVEAIDQIVLSGDMVFENPVQKVKWLAGCLDDCQHAKTQVEEELGKEKGEVDTLVMKIAEADTTVKSLEAALRTAKDEINQLGEEKGNMEQELRKAGEEAHSQSVRFVEECESRMSLEKALSLAESKMLLLASEKEEALGRVAFSEMEMEKFREEIATQTGRLAEADNTVKSLKNALSQAETEITALTHEKSDVVAEITHMESDLKKLSVEAQSQVVKLAEANETIESLKLALAKAESSIHPLGSEKAASEQEISSLNSKLNACMEELTGKSGSLASRSVELVSHLRELDMLVKDETSLTLMSQCFSKSLEGLRHVDLKITELRDHLSAGNWPENLIIEDNTHITEVSPDDINHINSSELPNGEVGAGDDSDISLDFKKIAAGLEMRNRIFAERLKHFSALAEESVIDSLKKIQATSNEVIDVIDRNRDLESWKQESKGMQIREEEKDRVISRLENDVAVLVSACMEATRQLFEVKERLPKVSSIPGLEKLNPSLVSELEETVVDDTAGEEAEGSESVKIGKKLFSAARKAQILVKVLLSASEVAFDTIQELQIELSNNRSTSQKYLEERDLYKSHVSELETTVETLPDSCKELNLVVEEYQSKENNWKLKEIELSAIHSSSLLKLQDLEKELDDIKIASKKDREEKDSYQTRVLKLESDVEALQDSCKELNGVLCDYEGKENRWKEKEAELHSLYNNLLIKSREAENHSLSASQISTLLEKLSKTEVPFAASEVEESVSYHSDDMEKLFYIVDNVTNLQQQMTLLSHEKGELESTLLQQSIEIDNLKKEIELYGQNSSELDNTKGELSELTFGLEKIICMLEGSEFIDGQKSVTARSLLPVLQNHAVFLSSEAQNLKSHSRELESKLLASEKFVDELSTKVKLLEESLESRTIQPEVRERSVFEASSAASGSEISEIEELGSLGKKTISPVPSAAHVRTLRKGSAEHLALNIDSETDHLLTAEETVEDKGHVFKSLNTTGLIPRQGKLIADRVDGVWVSSGRVLSNHPRARLSLIAYCLIMHVWVLGTVLS